MRTRVYGYFILPDGSISSTNPITGSCMTLTARNKREAELEMPYLDFDRDVYAEIQVSGDPHRILFVRAGALSSLGLHPRLYLGTDGYQRIELIAAEPSSLGRRIASVLDQIEDAYPVPLLVIRPQRGYDPDRVVRTILDITSQEGEIPPAEFLPYVCHTIPKHTLDSPDVFPGAMPISVPRWAA